MKKCIILQYVLLLLTVGLCIVVGSPVVWAADQMLENRSFESYDSSTGEFDGWQVIDGNVTVTTEYSYYGSKAAYSLGGTVTDGVDTPSDPQGGSLVQLVDLSTLADWESITWLTLDMYMRYRLYHANKISMIVEYLPQAYDDTTITVDDAAWDSADVRTATTLGGTAQASSTAYYQRAAVSDITIPKVRWARVRFVFDAQYGNSYSYDPDTDTWVKTEGDYYIALDGVSLTAEAMATEDPVEGDTLVNGGFESIVGEVPDGWHQLDGRMVTLDDTELPPYTGYGYAGNVGGTVTVDEETGETVDTPDLPQYGTLVQLVDMSEQEGWDDCGVILFAFSGYHMSFGINGDLSAMVQYLPASYNQTEVTWDDAAWESDDVAAAVSLSFDDTNGSWTAFATDQGSMPNVRWVRVVLEVEDSSCSDDQTSGAYLGGFDRVALVAEPSGEIPLANGGFEESSDGETADNWSQDPDGGALALMTDDAYAGSVYLGKTADGDDTTGCVYQVIDLAENIPGWTAAISSSSGESETRYYIQFNLSAWLINYGGTAVRVGLEYLPFSYNEVDDITWDNSAWEARNWTSDGSSFTNTGGDAIDLGFLIEDTTVDSTWHQATYTGWLPRVRWLRLRIELDATDTGEGTALVGIDEVSFSAVCKGTGPYSDQGPTSSNAIDEPIPGWVGPEGDGVSGGYTGKSDYNWVNPVFCGFADDYVSYDNSGQYIYNDYDKYPEAITGQPWNDSGWNEVIITLGDMELEMLADYFGPEPSGDYHPGEITAVFNESPIVNGEGHDFATFENGFASTGGIFAELAFVEVSTNGVDFIRMPTHSLTREWPGAYGTIDARGVFGMTGKHINAYGASWCTPFDLEWIADHPLVLDGTVDINDIRYVRQIDIPGGGPTDAQGSYTSLFYDDYGNPIFDAWPTWGSGGADLDAIGVINSSADDTDGDHITDYWDNCPQTANEKQYDTDEDGYGNMCDCDINGDEGGDGTVNMADYAVFRAAYGSTGGNDASENWNADADFNGDLQVNMADYAIFRSRWLQSAPFD